MDLEQLKQNFKTLNARIAEAMDQMRSDSRTLVEQAAQELFKAAPAIDHVFWNQYTPYHNDGEPCSFSVNDVYYVLEGEEDVDGEGSYLYTDEDYRNALANLEEVRKYVTDPTGWFEEVKTKKNLGVAAKPEWYRPWPYTVEGAQEEIDKIEQQMLKITMEDANRIEEAFTAFCECMKLIPDDIMLAVYDDHVRVKISRNGTETEEYRHD
jgi:tetratricopeptide (TPR) repeat protein